MHPFIQHLQKYVQTLAEHENEILSYFDTVHLSKKQNILSEGQICNTNYFVVKGCLRMFFIDERGVEQTVQFAIENWWMADNLSLLNATPTPFFIQAVEKSEVIAITKINQEKLVTAFPFIETYFRVMYQRAFAASQYRMMYMYELSKEDLYKHFINNQPEFAQRVPQYLLASYLGLTPEYVSELRKKFIS